MQFNSAAFVAFAVCFFSVWALLRSQKQRLWLLCIGSYVFYGYWDWRFLFLITASGLVDYFATLGMQRYPSARRALLWASIAGNIGSLALFKYADFVLETGAALFSMTIDAPPHRELGIVLPVGISFYTFQSMSYTIDVYRGRMEPTRSLAHFFAYLAMFPQLVAGPIVRANHLLPQLEAWRASTQEERWMGWRLIARGLFVKCVIADNLAPFVNEAFGFPSAYEAGGYWWLISLMFALQIYFDFSGYSAIARGLGLFMGLDIPVNFSRPYISSSFREFWTRWHISLSTWFRDYVYIPLGGSRSQKGRASLNLWITMLVSGLWHGAAWTFVAWGAAHAALLTIERYTKWPLRVPTAVATILVLGGTCATWVLFRAETFSDAAYVLSRMFDPAALLMPFSLAIVATAVLLLGVVWEVVGYLLERYPPAPNVGAEPIWYAALIVASVYFRGPANEFIYFQF